MRILHFVRFFTNNCGAYFYLLRFRKGLSKYGIEQRFLAYEHINNYRDFKSDIDVPIMKEINVNKFLEETNPDIVFFHDNVSYYLQPNREDYFDFYQLCEQKVRVGMFHSYNQIICPDYLDKSLGDCSDYLSNKCVEKNCIDYDLYHSYKNYMYHQKDFDSISVLSTDMLNRLYDIGFNQSKLFKIPPLISSTGCNSSSDKNIILFAGRIVEQKGVYYLIEAISKMKVNDIHVIIAGSGDMEYIKNILTQIRSYGLNHKIQLVGHLSQTELDEIYQKTKIYVFPSIAHEAYGFSGGEAISHGIPAITFKIEGVNEWLIDGYNGYSVPLKDTEAFAEKLDILMTDSTLYEKIRSNCVQWSKELNYDSQIDKLYNYLRSLISNKYTKNEVSV